MTHSSAASSSSTSSQSLQSQSQSQSQTSQSQCSHLSTECLLKEYSCDYGEIKKLHALPLIDHCKEVSQKTHKPLSYGEVILVTANTVLAASKGEGKTTTTIALTDALRQRGIDACGVLRQPSMGITAAGSKGGASGGGKSSLAQSEIADWGLCGEMSRIMDAQNFLCSVAEKAVLQNQITHISIPRVVEIPSQPMRSITTGVGTSNIAEKCVITAACEVMQIVTLSKSIIELRENIGNIILGTDDDGKPLFARDIAPIDNVLTILGSAIDPAILTTRNGSPVYMHCGPFANVSIGIPSLLSIEAAQLLHDVVIVEAGYGADAGAQKYLDIAVREYGAPLPNIGVVVSRVPSWFGTPGLEWRFPFNIQSLQKRGITVFPLVNLHSEEDRLLAQEKIDQLNKEGKPLSDQEPFVVDLWNDGAAGMLEQLDPLIEELQSCKSDVVNKNSVDTTCTTHSENDRKPQEGISENISQESSHDEEVHHALREKAQESWKKYDVMEKLTRLVGEAYGVTPDKFIYTPLFHESFDMITNLAKKANINLMDYSINAIKSPAVITDNDTSPQSERTITLKRVDIRAGARLIHIHLTTSLTTPLPKLA